MKKESPTCHSIVEQKFQYLSPANVNRKFIQTEYQKKRHKNMQEGYLMPAQQLRNS